MSSGTPTLSATAVSTAAGTATKALGLAILVAALGYFVDIYDLILFSIVRVSSLRGIGVPDSDLLGTGVILLNMQMAGMLVGGILWGILGDKRGRLSVLFGSILMYSLANIANGLVTGVGWYAAVRLLAGIGLAGELGAGITLVSESMSKENRGYGTMLVAAVGILGAVVAVAVGGAFSWPTAYFVGGGMGLCLLVAQVGVYESGAFTQMMAHETVARGDFLSLLKSRTQLRKYASVVLIGLPIWYVIAILVTFSPEIGAAMGMRPAPDAGRAVLFCYLGASAGGVISGALSQIFRTRKKIVRSFILVCGGLIGVHFVVANHSLAVFFTMCLALGIAVGYWAVFLTMAAEQFGTNIRATVTTTAPNFVRGAVVPITVGFQVLRKFVGIEASALLIGFATITIALIAAMNQRPTIARLISRRISSVLTR